MFLYSVIFVAESKQKRLSLKGNGKVGKGAFKTRCTSFFAKFLGSFASLAIGAVRASPSLGHLEQGPYISLISRWKCRQQEQPELL